MGSWLEIVGGAGGLLGCKLKDQDLLGGGCLVMGLFVFRMN